ncbi:hypothetical protein [Streptomyces sp. Tue6028]|uniref:hypothetical protein n=1 Tax=Streptomyces sp. Tue6028 TaxID=2036037 RepID=UPI003D7130E3
MRTSLPPDVALVVATLRMASQHQRCDADRHELEWVAQEVEADWDGACCPVFQEATCDTDCPLAAIRATQPGGEAVTPPVDEYRLSTR